MSFPLPEPTPLSQPYWDALSDGRLTFQHCGKCGHNWLPPRAECPECLGPEWDWQAASGTVKCPCHFSEFDLKAGARVLNGPAQRRLPALPLKIADGAPAVAAGFVGRPGFESGG